MSEFAALPRWIWAWLVAFVAIGVLGALAVIGLSPTKYDATATDFVSTGGTVAGIQSLAATVYVQTRMSSYAELATGDVVLARTIGDLRLKTTPAQLATSITATARPGSLLIDLSATAATPAKAKALVGSIASNLRDVVDTTVENDAIKDVSLVRLQVVNPATAGTAPTYPNVTALLVGGGILGAIAWIGIVMILARLTARVRSIADVSVVTDLAVLTRIERAASAFRIAVSIQSNPGGAVAESIRALRTNLAFTGAGDRPLVVTSTIPNEGKTTVAINLALAMALAGERVVLVDADLRRPSVASILNLNGRTGLTNVLRGSMRLDNVLQTWGIDSPFSVLPSGSIPPNPTELIGSGAMRALLAELALRFDRVVIDAPPVLVAPDAGILSGETDAAIMVVGMGRITREQFTRSLEVLAVAGSRPLGLVLNLFDSNDSAAALRRAEVDA